MLKMHELKYRWLVLVALYKYERIKDLILGIYEDPFQDTRPDEAYY